MEAIDFMDPRQRRRHTLQLMLGYVLIGVAILLLSVILLFVAYGFGYKNGQVFQSGLLFVSSTPSPAQITINGARYSSTTNTRVELPAGIYNFALNRAGYRSWQHSIIVNGGQVMYYQYPFLFPTTLTSTSLRQYSSSPTLVSQSPDRRWLLVSRSALGDSFDMYDLNNPKQAAVVVTIPSQLLSPAMSGQSLQVVEWSDDNTHLLLKHTYNGNDEYILFDRSNPDQSLNLSKTLALSPTNIDLQLSNKHYDQYLLLDASDHGLSRSSLSNPTPQPYIDKVITYTSYGDNTILYATPDVQDSTKVDINLFDGSNTYLIRHEPANTSYLLDLTTYSGQMYVGVSASSEKFEYVYQDPVSQITNPQLNVAVPIRVFNVSNPTYLSFSANAQYIVFENGVNFAVYDIENQQGYAYSLPNVIDPPEAHANWMDAARLTYVSNGQALIFDYDGTNKQTLFSADPHYLPFFDQNYKFIYTFKSLGANSHDERIIKTSLRTPQDS